GGASRPSRRDICGSTRSRWDQRALARSPIPAPPPRRRAMRTSDFILSIGLLGLAFGLSPAAVSFDGTRTPDGATVAVPLPAPGANNLGNGNPLGSATPLAAVPGSPPVAPLHMPPRPVMPPTPLQAFRA